MTERVVELGEIRGPSDGCRRYRPIQLDYDTRNLVLEVEIRSDFAPEIKAMWEHNQAQVRAELELELGAWDGAQKFENYRAMGPSPWSVVFEHTRLLRQVRAAFAHGDFFPALVGACALAERLLQQLVLALRPDYLDHRSTPKQIRSGRLRPSWKPLIATLHAWGVLDEDTAATYGRLEARRHQAVHFDARLNADSREPALEALLDLQRIIAVVLEPHGGPPRYIPGTSGASFLSLRAEQEPLVRRIFIPNSVLVSPQYRLEYDRESAQGWVAYDDADCDGELSDEEFAQRLNAANEPAADI